jgi:predicted signal transduction protein with EAL and GGDEF domain
MASIHATSTSRSPESAVMVDPSRQPSSLALRKLGVGIRSTISAPAIPRSRSLKRLPFRLDQDRPQLRDRHHPQPDDAGDRHRDHRMAHRLKLKVVAEGVETQASSNYLRANGCDEMQGYLFSPAVDAAAFESCLRQRPSV